MSTVYTLNGKVLKNAVNGKWLAKKGVDPLNPLGLPPNTVRVRTSDGEVPVKYWQTSYETATLVTGTTDVYDIYKSGTNFSNLLYTSSNVIEVLGANTTGITNMDRMFTDCNLLTSAPVFDTSSVTSMTWMFSGCSLTSIPLFNTSNVTSMFRTFNNCSKVESGALALYQQASTQTNPPAETRICIL